MTIRRLFLLFFVTAVPTFSVSGVYTLKIQSIANNLRPDYGITTQTELVETISIRHKGDALDFFVTFSAGQSGTALARSMVSGTSDELFYQLYDSSVSMNVLLDIGDSPTIANVLFGSFGASASWQTVIVSFTLIIPADQYVPKDTYADAFDVTLYSGDLTTYLSEDTANVGASSVVPEIVEVSVIPTGAAFDPLATQLDLDYGLLVDGESLTGDVVVRSNAVYTLSLQSANRGVMVHATPSETSEIPYDFRFTGASVSLTSNQATDVVVDAAATDTAGVRYDFEIIILPFGMATEGNYDDSITIEISAQ